jgi:hypothetical protein
MVIKNVHDISKVLIRWCWVIHYLAQVDSTFDGFVSGGFGRVEYRIDLWIARLASQALGPHQIASCVYDQCQGLLGCPQSNLGEVLSLALCRDWDTGWLDAVAALRRWLHGPGNCISACMAPLHCLQKSLAWAFRWLSTPRVHQAGMMVPTKKL